MKSSRCIFRQRLLEDREKALKIEYKLQREYDEKVRRWRYS